MTYRLEGYDPFSGDEYPLGTIYDECEPSYETREAALAGALKRLAELERTQPTSSSGGQGYDGIQDRVYIVGPDGKRERVFLG